MRIVVHVNSFYDWERVPDGVEVTDKDLALGRAKKDQHGNFVMRVIRRGDTHTTIAMPENQLIAEIVDHFIHKHVALTRGEAAAMHVARVMVDHAHRKWMMHFEFQDDGPDEVLFRQVLEAHANPATTHPETGLPLVDPRPTISEEDIPDLVDAYLTPVTHEEHAEHHHAHFRVPRSERVSGAETAQETTEETAK